VPWEEGIAAMTELALHILDIVENSLAAKATSIAIHVNEEETTDIFSIKIIDNGKGMDSETLNNVQDPFFTTRTTRKVGMGISLFKQAAEQCAGSLSIRSQLQKGTEISVQMQRSHVDRQPLGDIAGVLIQLYCSYSEVAFTYIHTTCIGQYEFDSVEIRNILGDNSPLNGEVRNFIKSMIQENLEAIKASK
jgi:hypothetical protein